MIRINVFLVTIFFGIVAATAGCFAQDELPSADEVISTYITAIGGRERLESVTSMELHATRILIPTETREKYESTLSLAVSEGRWVYSVRDDQKDGGHEAKSGFDGTRQWRQKRGQKPEWTEGGVFLNDNKVSANERDPIAISLYWLNFPGIIDTVGTTEIEGRRYYRLKLTPSAPDPEGLSRWSPKALLFDVEKGLLKQIDFDHQTYSYDDYRDVNGILIPFRCREHTHVGGINSHAETVVNSIKLNAELDDGLFVSPVEDADDDDK